MRAPRAPGSPDHDIRASDPVRRASTVELACALGKRDSGWHVAGSSRAEHDTDCRCVKQSYDERQAVDDASLNNTLGNGPVDDSTVDRPVDDRTTGGCHLNN